MQIIENQSANPKDLNEWLAGGTFRNESFPGGASFSPTSKPCLENKKNGTSHDTMMLAGDFSYLNQGLNEVNSHVNGDGLDINFTEAKDTFIDTKISFTIVDTITNDILVEESTEIDNYSLSVDLSAARTSFQDLSDIYNNKLNLVTFGFSNPVKLIINITTLLDSKSIEQVVGRVVTGSVIGIFKQATIEATIGFLGLTQTASILAVGFSLSALFDETIEYAMGIDNSFGFGGEFVGTDKYGNKHYSSPVSIKDGVLSVIGLSDALERSITSAQIEYELNDILFEQELDEIIEEELDEIINEGSYPNDDSNNDADGYSSYGEDSTGGEGNNDNSESEADDADEGGWGDGSGGWGGV